MCDGGNPQEESTEGRHNDPEEAADEACDASSAEEVVNVADIVGLMQTITEWVEFEAEECGG